MQARMLSRSNLSKMFMAALAIVALLPSCTTTFPKVPGTRSALRPHASGEVLGDTIVYATDWEIGGNVRVRCYFSYAKYDYEAWLYEVLYRKVGTGPWKEVSRRRVKADRITMDIWREVGGANYTHECRSSDYCNKTDKVVTLYACGKTRMTATAWYRGQRRSATWQ